MCRRILLLCLSLLLLCALGAAPKAHAQVGRHLLILVRDAKTQHPIPSVSLHLKRGPSTSTDAEGRCQLSLPSSPGSTIVLSLAKPGYQTIREHSYSLPTEGKPLIIDLEPRSERHLEGVTVTGAGRESSLTQQSTVLRTAHLQAQSEKSIARLLEALPGVSSIKSGATISKPMIQGMHSSRILLISNGVRLESQSWGADHAPEVDHTGAGQVEVIKGAEAVRYGAGALGGVVLINPSPQPTNSPTEVMPTSATRPTVEV